MKAGDRVGVYEQWQLAFGASEVTLVKMEPFDGREAWICRRDDGEQFYGAYWCFKVLDGHTQCRCPQDVLMSKGCQCGGS